MKNCTYNYIGIILYISVYRYMNIGKLKLPINTATWYNVYNAKHLSIECLSKSKMHT